MDVVAMLREVDVAEFTTTRDWTHRKESPLYKYRVAFLSTPGLVRYSDSAIFADLLLRLVDRMLAQTHNRSLHTIGSEEDRGLDEQMQCMRIVASCITAAVAPYKGKLWEHLSYYVNLYKNNIYLPVVRNMLVEEFPGLFD